MTEAELSVQSVRDAIAQHDWPEKPRSGLHVPVCHHCESGKADYLVVFRDPLVVYADGVIEGLHLAQRAMARGLSPTEVAKAWRERRTFWEKSNRER